MQAEYIQHEPLKDRTHRRQKTLEKEPSTESQPFYSFVRTSHMAIRYQTLAFEFAPDLYYKEPKNSYEDISPKDMGGIYWRAIPSSASWVDVCIQYIVFFRQQSWVPSILDKFSGKLPGNHPNDYVPLFSYFKKEKLVRVVFDICHYEAVGVISTPSVYLHPDEKPKFQIKNFYRGLLPLEDDKGLNPLGGVPTLLSQERLTYWWKGFTSEGSFDERARLIIKKKLEDPFKKITTFRDHAAKLGFIFHWIFRSAKDYLVQGLPIDVDALPSQVENIIGNKRKYFSHDDIKGITEFVDENIFQDSKMPEYLALRGYKKFQRI